MCQLCLYHCTRNSWDCRVIWYSYSSQEPFFLSYFFLSSKDFKKHIKENSHIYSHQSVRITDYFCLVLWGRFLVIEFQMRWHLKEEFRKCSLLGAFKILLPRRPLSVLTHRNQWYFPNVLPSSSRRKVEKNICIHICWWTIPCILYLWVQ